MRSSLALLAVLGVALAVLLSPRSGDVTTNAHRAEVAEELAEVTAPTAAMLARTLSGSAAGADLGAAYRRARRQAIASGERTARQAPAVAEKRWELVGPREIGGRVLDLAIDPRDRETIYAATASGGVFRSTDAGRTFHPRWPDDEVQPVGSVAITPDGVLYAGTGESGPGGGSMTYGGRGVFRSDDAGKSWKHLGLEGTHRISRVVVDPGDPKRIWVAASGNLFKAGGERGLYRSDDAGKTWKLVLAGANGTTGATDIAIDPQNPRNVLAAMWDHKRGPNEHSYTGVGSGLFRSTDGGETWTRTGGPLLTALPTLGRIGVAYAPSNPKVAYAIAAMQTGRTPFLFKTTDGGATWTPTTDANIAQSGSSFGWWFGRLWVAPDDPNDLFIAGVNLIRSVNGGSSTSSIGGVHADQHAMAWDPENPDVVYLGNDGGVYRSEEGGRSGSWEFADDQPFSQLYSLDVSEQDAGRQVAGLQDNGVNLSYGADGWQSYGGGDGERTLINPKNQNIVYGCSQYGNCFVDRTGGGLGSKDNFTQKVVSLRKNWFTPIEFDLDNPSVVYTGGEIMSRSTNDARDWTPISPDLSNGPQPDPDPDYRSFGSLTTISPWGGTVYAGTDDGNLWFNHDNGTPTGWKKATDADLPKAWITRVQIDPRDATKKTAYVTYSGFRSGDGGSIFRTTDGGANWTDITGDLPAAPLNDVNVVGDALVVASDVGVYLSRDGGERWRRLGDGLPLAPVHELRHHAPTDALYAATFGRSMWKVDLKGLVG
jgi:photosystem II stability/assembly factor-like uncharacterized protein